MRKKRRSRAFKKSSQVIDIEEVRRERKQKRKETSEKKKVKKVQPAISERHATKVIRCRLIYTVVFLIIIVVIALTTYDLFFLKAREKAEVGRQEALLKEKARLEEELQHVDSGEYVEDQARTQLHMIKPGEKIYVLPDDDKDAKEEDSDSEDKKETKSIIP